MDLPTDEMLAEKRDGGGWLVFDNPARHDATSPAGNLGRSSSRAGR